MSANLDSALSKVVVLGAAGKMGCGIALMAIRMAKEIVLLDSDSQRLDGLRSYLQTHVEDKSLIERAIFTTNMQDCAGATLLFEAILEDEAIKIGVYSKLKAICSPSCVYLTNTSSIPISVLDDKAGLNGHILGFHFYNPPPVQKLVELIWSKKTPPALKDLAVALGKKMDKILVPSFDVAGFIGNGHFMRDILFACDQVQKLRTQRDSSSAVYIVNRVSQDWLLRPMGIFQLVDYVGLDVCRNILKVMTAHIEGQKFGHVLLEEFAAANKMGGQFPDGTQKDGILKYEQKRPVAIWDLESKTYRAFDGWSTACDSELGPLPAGHQPWKALMRDPEKSNKLNTYFSTLRTDTSMGSEIARKYMARSRTIAEELVKQGVAEKLTDVDEVLRRGFAHLYGPAEVPA